MAIKRDQIKPPVLPRAAVPIDAAPLHGEVVVRGMLLNERLSLIGAARQAGEAVDFGYVSEVLAVSVLAEDNKPVYTAAEWEEFGAVHMGVALELFNKAQELSGLNGEAVKKS